MTEAFYDGPRGASDARAHDRGADGELRPRARAPSRGSVPAVALGIVGLGSRRRASSSLVARQRYPESTFTRTVFLPTGEAAIALGRGAPNDALTALEAARPTEFGTVAGLVPTFLRGEAYLAKHEPDAARAEFQKVLDHRGSDPFAPVVPLARLGLARTWQMIGNIEKSRQEYDELLKIWKNADADLPLLQRAREERARLGGTQPAYTVTESRTTRTRRATRRCHCPLPPRRAAGPRQRHHDLSRPRSEAGSGRRRQSAGAGTRC